jgi:RimJ/RimL family protein N-acetyltransferase
MMLIMPSLVAPAIPVGAFAASDQPTLPIGSRVLLRPWRLADAEAVTEAFQNPEIQRWHVRRADSVEEARKWIEDWQSSWRSETGGHWAVAGAEGDELLGRVSLKSLHLEDGKAEVAYWMAPAARLYPCSNVAVALGP